MSSKFTKRFQFARQQTMDSVDRVVELDSVGKSSDVKHPPQDKELGQTTSVSVGEDLAMQRRLSTFKAENRWDPNLEDPNDTFADIDDTLHDHNVEGEHALVDRLLENSPYPEVRAAVRNYDVDLPASTIRAWVIGMLLTTIGSGLNALFTLRSPAISITSIVAQLVAYPLGVGWSWAMPNRQFNTFGVKWNLNPGPFNFKEHTIIVIMANASFGGGAGYFTDTIERLNIYFWIAGGLSPFIVYFGARMFPKSPIRYVNMPIIFGALGDLPPATPLNYLSWVAVGTFFNKYLRNKYRGWWMRFNYITSAGLDSGLAICTIIIIAALSLTNTNAPNWWGNVGALNTLDTNDAAIKITGETFGPKTW